MKEHTRNAAFRVFEVGAGEQIDLRDIGLLPGGRSEVRPIACYVKPDGSKHDKASVVFVMVDKHNLPAAYAQITKAMLKPVLELLEGME